MSKTVRDQPESPSAVIDYEQWRPHRSAPTRAGVRHVLVGIAWGNLIGMFATYSHESIQLVPLAEIPALTLALTGFVLASFLAIGVMFVSGLIYACVGKTGLRRWLVLGSTLISIQMGNGIALAILDSRY